MTLIPDLERDLVTAAGRVRSVRRRTLRAAALGTAAAAAAALALVTFWSSEEAPGPKRAAGKQRQAPPAPPRYVPPVPGTLVELSSFGFRGVRYELSGYRSRDGSVCLRMQQVPPEPGATDDRPSVMCAGGRYLRRRLRSERVLNVAGGGGERVKVSGFTIAGVSRVEVLGTNRPRHVELTRPWRPWDGPRIRAFLIVVEAPPGADISSRPFGRIRAVEAGG